MALSLRVSMKSINNEDDALIFSRSFPGTSTFSSNLLLKTSLKVEPLSRLPYQGSLCPLARFDQWGHQWIRRGGEEWSIELVLTCCRFYSCRYLLGSLFIISKSMLAASTNHTAQWFQIKFVAQCTHSQPEVRREPLLCLLFQLSYCEQASISQSVNTMFSHVCAFLLVISLLNGPQAYCGSAV